MKELLQSKTSSATSSAPPNRAKVSRSRDSPRFESSQKVPPISTSKSNSNPRAKRSVLPNKARLDEEPISNKRESRTAIQPAERRSVSNCKRCRDLQKRVEESELEILSLKVEVEKLQSLNVELQAQKQQLANDSSAAEVKIAVLEKRLLQSVSAGHESEPSKGSKTVDKENKGAQIQSGAKAVESSSQLQSSPLPPPPPPPQLGPSRENKKQTASAFVEFYHCFTKREGKINDKGNGNGSSPASSSVHNSIVGELQNRSAHLLSIKADVESKGEFINHLINEVKSAAFTNMDHLLTFVNWLDGELSKLADERAVLKHFNWPERKADALREAAVEYRHIKQLHALVYSFEDDSSLASEEILKKIVNLVDRSERNVQRLIKLRGTAMIIFKEMKVPTEWMLDSGMISEIKVATVELTKVYIMRLLTELEFSGQIERGSAQESLLSQGVRFAYRVYQFAGGLDSETMRTLEKLRSLIQWRESRELIHGMSFNQYAT